MKVIDYKKFQLSKLVYDKPVKVKGGCLMTKTGYKLDNQTIPVCIQTPKLKTNSGIILNDTRSYIDLELDKNHLGFYEFITNLDEQNLTTTHSNSEEWFGQTLPMDVIDDFYNSPLKMSKLEKAPNVKFKIPVSKGRPICEIFGENARPLEHNLVTKDTEVICILQLLGIKYYKQRFECDWQVLQMRSFIDDYIPKTCLIDESLMTDFEKEPEVFSINTNEVTPENVVEETNREENVVEKTTSEEVQEAIPEANISELTLSENTTIEVVPNTTSEEFSLESTDNVETLELNAESLEGNKLEIENLDLPDDIEDSEGSVLSEDFELEQDFDSSDSLILEDDIPGENDLFNLSDGESLQDESDEISDLDENVEEVYLDDEGASEEEDLEEDIDLDLEEVKLNSNSEVANLMSEIEELKNIAIKKDEEVRKLKEIGQTIN
jgi:hypothetical protein